MLKRNPHLTSFIWIALISQALFAIACKDHPAQQTSTRAATPGNGRSADGVEAKNTSPDLYTLLKPTNSTVVSDIPITTVQSSNQSPSIAALGQVDYDTRRVQTIAARVSGRIEKLYVHYRYQHVHMGDKIMDIYSPELVTAQQDLLFILHNDPGNTSLVDATRTKLLLLGMDNHQLQQVIQSGKPSYTFTIYTSFPGHIHESGSMNTPAGYGQPSVANSPSMDGANTNAPATDAPSPNGELPLKEGMYVQKGQTLFQLYNTDQSWVILHLYPGNAARIKEGAPVTITPETSPDKPFTAIINYIEPFYRPDSKTLTARVYFDNMRRMLPIGSQVKATIQGAAGPGNWLPREAVLSFGLHQVVLKRENGLFQVAAVQTGVTTDSLIQITGGLTAKDTVAADAQYLMDSESFIKVKQ